MAAPSSRQEKEASDKNENRRSFERRFSSIGVTGFEPAASSSRTKRATKLRYTPSEPLFISGMTNFES